MKLQNLLIALSACLVTTTVQAQTKSEGGLLLDPQDRPVSKEVFLKLIDQPDIILAKNDSLPNYKAVAERSEKGEITNYEEIITTLTNAAIAVDRTKAIVIIYYPGKDRCNDSGSASESATKSDTKLWYNKLVGRIQKIAQTTPLHLYRTKEGLNMDEGIIPWHKDPQQIIEKTFFKYHYPCGSYTIISPNGKYISYFGEFPQEFLFKDLKEIIK